MSDISDKMFTGYKGIKIHYMEKEVHEDSAIPVIIVPALPESAIDYKDIIYLLPNRVIGLTHRGRESSEAPESGYSISDHGEDIKSAIEFFNLEELVIVAYSRGVTYFLDILPKIHEKIKGAIIVDYPAEYTSHDESWPTEFIKQTWRAIPNKERFPKPWVLNRIQEDSIDSDLWNNLTFLEKKHVLLMVGARHYSDPFLIRSKIKDEHIDKYKEFLPNIEIVEFENSGHDFRLWEYDKFIDTIRVFLYKFNPTEGIKSIDSNSNYKKANPIKKLKNLFTRSPGIDKDKILKLD